MVVGNFQIAELKIPSFRGSRISSSGDAVRSNVISAPARQKLTNARGWAREREREREREGIRLTRTKKGCL